MRRASLSNLDAGNVENLPPVEIRTAKRTADGQFGTEKQRKAKELARGLVEDPDYLDALRARLLAGEAGNMEPLLWRYAHGDPPKGDNEDNKRMMERLAATREELSTFIRDHPESARILEAKVVKRKALPFPGVTDVPKAE